MPRRQRERSTTIMSVNLTPAIDITFNLLIFFLVATTFKAAEGVLSSRVPSEQGLLEAVPLPISPVRIRLRQMGDGPEDYTLSIDHWRRSPESFRELTRILEALLDKPGFDEATPIVIMPDEDVCWDHVVGCFNAIRRVNWGVPNRPSFKNITFSGK